MLPYNAVNFLALPYLIGQSLLYPLVFVATRGEADFCKNSRQILCIFVSLSLCHNKVSCSILRSRPALPYDRRGAHHWMPCCRATAQCAARQPTIQYRPPRRSRGGRYWMVGCPATHWAVARQHNIQCWAPCLSYRKVVARSKFWTRDLVMTEGQGPKNASSLARICAKKKKRLPGSSDEDQWIEQRLAYKIGKCEKVVLRYMGVLEFKT